MGGNQARCEAQAGGLHPQKHRGARGSLDIHGNPNVLTRDEGTSSLGQGPTSATAVVEIEKFEGNVPKITVFNPPALVQA